MLERRQDARRQVWEPAAFHEITRKSGREAKEPPAIFPKKTGLEVRGLAVQPTWAICHRQGHRSAGSTPARSANEVLVSRLFSFGFLGLCVPRRKPGAHSKKAAPPPPFPFTHTHPRREAQATRHAMEYSAKTISVLQEGANAIKSAAQNQDWPFLETLVSQSGLTLAQILQQALIPSSQINACLDLYRKHR